MARSSDMGIIGVASTGASLFFFLSFWAAAGVAAANRITAPSNSKIAGRRPCQLDAFIARFFIRMGLLARFILLFGENNTMLPAWRACVQSVYFVCEALSRFTNKRYAPGTPSGNWRKKAMPV